MKLKIKTLFLFAFLISQFTYAKQSIIYPGVYQATINSIKAAHKTVLTIDVWAGFQRQFIVTLPHLEVPIADKKAPICQLKLIKEGLKYTKKQIKGADKIEVRDIKMDDSTKKNATAEIYLDGKKLSKQLLAKHYARPDSIEKNKVWCSDEK